MKRESLVQEVKEAVDDLVGAMNDFCLALQQMPDATPDDLATFNANVAAEFASRLISSTAFQSGNPLPKMIEEHMKAVKINSAIDYKFIVDSGYEPGEPLS